MRRSRALAEDPTVRNLPRRSDSLLERFDGIGHKRWVCTSLPSSRDMVGTYTADGSLEYATMMMSFSLSLSAVVMVSESTLIRNVFNS